MFILLINIFSAFQILNREWQVMSNECQNSNWQYAIDNNRIQLKIVRKKLETVYCKLSVILQTVNTVVSKTTV